MNGGEEAVDRLLEHAVVVWAEDEAKAGGFRWN